MRLPTLIGTVLTGLLLIAGKAGASGVDLHWLWDNQCADCHGHSSEFAHSFLKLVDGRLQGNHRDRSLRLFYEIITLTTPKLKLFTKCCGHRY